MFIKINGKTHYLWRAVDQDGSVLDILVTSRRDAKAATRFFRKLLTGLEYVPRVLVTDKLASYGVARHRLMTGVEHRRSKYLNNRAENSHQPTRQRERAMKRFTSAGHAQRFLSAFSGISPHFRPRRHLLHAEEYRREMANRFSTWNEVGQLQPLGRARWVSCRISCSSRRLPAQSTHPSPQQSQVPLPFQESHRLRLQSRRRRTRNQLYGI